MKKSKLMICSTIILTMLFLSGCKKDETPPTIYNVPDEGYSIAYGEDVDFEQLIKDDEVTAIDEVDGEVDYEIDSSEIDVNTAGIYYLYITAYDKAENGKQAIVPIEVKKQSKIINDFLQSYNDLLAEKSSNDLVKFGDYYIYLDNINNYGNVDIGNNCSIMINSDELFDPQNELSYVTLFSVNSSDRDDKFMLEQFMCVLHAIDADFTDTEVAHILYYMIGEIDTPPEIEGYEFINDSVGNSFFFDIKIL